MKKRGNKYDLGRQTNMIIDLIFLGFSIIFLLIGIKIRKKYLIIFTGMSVLFSLSSILLCLIFSLKYIPNIKAFIYLIFFTAIMCIFFFSTMKVIGSIFCVIILISSCLIYYLYNDNIGVTYRNFNGIDYIGTYCKINKGSVCVTYYESKFSLFMESEHSFIDTYIGTGEDYDEIIDNEPYNREFNVSYIN